MRNASPFLISIIIPTYNYAHTLERAVNSAHEQLESDCELIIINDGSTDHTREVLATFEQKFPRAQVVHKENGGAASARNAGIERAQGSYLVFLDADDALQPQAIAILKKSIIETQAEFIIGGHESIAPNGHTKKHLPKSLPLSPAARLKGYLIDKTISLSNGGCAIKRSVFQQIRYPETLKNAEDIPVFAYLMANCVCVHINSVLVSVYKHTDSLRHQVEHTLQVGMELVEAVFAAIPEELQYLKRAFTTQRLLSLSRAAYEASLYSVAQHFYLRAFKNDLRVLFKWFYTKKFLISQLSTK